MCLCVHIQVYMYVFACAYRVCFEITLDLNSENCVASLQFCNLGNLGLLKNSTQI